MSFFDFQAVFRDGVREILTAANDANHVMSWLLGYPEFASGRLAILASAAGKKDLGALLRLEKFLCTTPLFFSPQTTILLSHCQVIV